MEVRATLHVGRERDVRAGPGPAEGQTYQRLNRAEDRPTDRVRLGRSTYRACAVERLHTRLT